MRPTGGEKGVNGYPGFYGIRFRVCRIWFLFSLVALVGAFSPAAGELRRLVLRFGPGPIFLFIFIFVIYNCYLFVCFFLYFILYVSAFIFHFFIFEF